MHLTPDALLRSSSSTNLEPAISDRRMKTPRAAAIAGIVFALLFSTSLLLIWVSIPENPLGPPAAVIRHLKTISFSLNLLPFAGIAFLWFIAVVRDRLGALEDRFFASVFLGSGLLFIASVFNAAIVAGAIIWILGRGTDLTQFGTYALGRAEIVQAMQIYAMRMAGVFMITTSTISFQTRLFPRWMALLGYALALMLLLSLGTIQWIPLVFPFWVLLISMHILSQNLRGLPE